jgi:glycosyltransferase involved in cell wall biosynthesis
MMKKYLIIIALCVSYACIGQIAKGKAWVNYYHMLHGDTIEFVPASMIDSIYKKTNNDHHYGWTFINDSVVDIMKEHYVSGTKEQIRHTPVDPEFFDPPQVKIKVDIITNRNKDSSIFSFHTWDHIKVNFVQANSVITFSRGIEKRSYRIVEMREDYLKVVVIK